MVKISKVLIADEIDRCCIDKLKSANIDVLVKVKLSEDQLIDEIKKNSVNGVVVRSATKITANILSATEGTLKIVGRAGTGVDNIDVDAASMCGVLVMNTPQGNSVSAAELTCFHIMALARSAPQAYQSMTKGKWDRKHYMGEELYDKTLAIVGLGRIGREVATRMQAFGMKTIGFDPLVSKEQAASFNVTLYENVDALWPLADYITFHVPLIAQTKYILNKNTMSQCKKGVKVVNCARGGIINESDLVEALNQGQVGGAGFDVFEQEPPAADNPLRTHPNVICTPHLGASTNEAQKRVAVEVAENIIALNDRNEMPGVLNASKVLLNNGVTNGVSNGIC